jgi:hypothetical protein
MIAAENILIEKHQRYRQMLRDILADEVSLVIHFLKDSKLLITIF